MTTNSRYGGGDANKGLNDLAQFLTKEHPAKMKSKGSVSQLMDDLDLIIEQVEVMVNSIQKGVENVLRK